MLNGKHYQIKDMAKLLQVPVSTLYYWEKEKLIESNRMENKYRIFGSRDFFDLWEVQMYRSLQVPISELRELKTMNVDEINQLLEEKRSVLEEEIRQKEKALKRLESYQQGFHTWKALNKAGLSLNFEEPDMDYLYEDQFIKQTMEQTIEHPTDCCILFQREEGFQPVMCIPPRENELTDHKLLWEKKKSGCDAYVLTGIQTLVNHMEVNTIQEQILRIEECGYEVNYVISSYLFTAAQGEQRYEYHKAWFGIVRKNG